MNADLLYRIYFTKKSISHLSEKSDPDKMDDDWVTNFFDMANFN
jgi:hypothetical protein